MNISLPDKETTVNVEKTLADVKSLRQQTQVAETNLGEQLYDYIDSFFAKKVSVTTDIDLRREFAALRQAKTFLLNPDDSLTFYTVHYGQTVKYAVSLEELLQV